MPVGNPSRAGILWFRAANDMLVASRLSLSPRGAGDRKQPVTHGPARQAPETTDLRLWAREGGCYPPAIAPTTMKASLPSVTLSGRGSSGASLERSSPAAKKRTNARRSWVE